MINNSKDIKEQPKKNIFFYLSVVVILISLSLAGVFFFLYTQEKKKFDEQKNNLSQTDIAEEKMKKLIKIYETDPPTKGVIKDVELLKKENPEFYKNAKNGNSVFIYSKRAIIYDSEENIIVNVAPIVGQQNPSGVITTTPTAKPTTTPTKK